MTIPIHKRLEKRDHGLTWSRHIGWRVIVVIDDFYDAVSLSSPPSAHAYGLREIWDQTKEWNETRAIGFFRLPDSEDQIDIIIEAINNWTSSFNDNNWKYYLLVDHYSGEGFSRPMGMKFVERWIESMKGDQDGKIAFFSIGGTAEGLVDRPKYSIFDKTRIKNSVRDRQTLPTNFLTWLDFSEHPLNRFWNDTEQWLHDQESELPHDVHENNFKRITDRVKPVLEEMLGGQLDSWFEDWKSYYPLHECLKTICGQTSCFNKGKDGNPLSIYGAYLIATMAYHNTFPENSVEKFTKACKWGKIEVGLSRYASILPPQDIELAKETVETLFDMFCGLFKHKADDSDTIKDFEISGRRLRIILAFDSNLLQKKLSNVVFNFYNQITKDNTGEVLPTGLSTDLILK